MFGGDIMILYDYKYDIKTGKGRTRLVISPLWIGIVLVAITSITYWVW